MMEGTVPVPLTASALRTIMTYYLYRRYRMFWGAQGGGCGGNACRSPQERYFGFSNDFNKAQETIVITVIPPFHARRTEIQ